MKDGKKELERYKRLHEAELGLCEADCDIVREEKKKIAALSKRVKELEEELNKALEFYKLPSVVISQQEKIAALVAEKKELENIIKDTSEAVQFGQSKATIASILAKGI